MLKPYFALALSALALPLAAAQEPRLLKIEDIHALKLVQDPQVSPDGRWVAYVVRKDDTEEDRQDTDVWMVPFAGGEAVRLTASPKGESRPRWSPDNRWLAFLSSREGDSAQVWLLDRRGGEAVKLTDYEGGVSDLAWSPDGKRLALVVTDPEPADPAAAGDAKDKDKKKDRAEADRHPAAPVQAGHRVPRRAPDHLHLFDLESRKGVQITSGPFDDEQPAWSPDGRWIAFSSKRAGADPDATDNSDIFLVGPGGGAAPRALTTWEGRTRRRSGARTASGSSMWPAAIRRTSGTTRAPSQLFRWPVAGGPPACSPERATAMPPSPASLPTAGPSSSSWRTAATSISRGYPPSPGEAPSRRWWPASERS